MSLPLTERELATVLAALRHWQRTMVHQPSLAAEFPHFEQHSPLNLEELDDLCERLNATGCQSLQCECELPGAFCSGVPGILAQVQEGCLVSGTTVERCDLCQSYASDEEAAAELARQTMLHRT